MKNFKIFVKLIFLLVSILIVISLNFFTKLEIIYSVTLLFILYLYSEKKYFFYDVSNKLIADREYIDTIIESNNTAIIAINWLGVIVAYNKKSELLFGWNKSEMLHSKNLEKLIPMKYSMAHKLALKNYLKTGTSCGVIGHTHELEAINKEGKIFPIKISFGSNNKKRNTIIIANIIDLTQEKEKEKQFFQQLKLLQMGEMISMIAHQWRQPLSAISATSGAMILRAKLDKLDNNAVIELSSKISEYSQHLSATIDDFRNFFKPNKNREMITYTELIDSVLNIVEASLLSKNIVIKKNLVSEKFFSTYSNEIKQVLLNLIKNAEDILIEKEIKNPLIIIKTEGNILSIEDNAGGIPNEIISKIFDPYFSTKLEKNGTGLGLYMSKTIIEEHCEGTLGVQNSNEGAIFTITIN